MKRLRCDVMGSLLTTLLQIVECASEQVLTIFHSVILWNG